MIDTTHKNAHILNQINGKIPRSGVIDKKMINTHDLCYQCCKDSPEYLFGNLSMRDCKYEAYFLVKRELISCKIKTKTMFKKNKGTKKGEYDMNINKALKIIDWILKTNNKLFVAFNPKNVCKLEFAYHLWLPFLDQNQPYILVFVIINLQIYNIPVKNGNME